MPDESILETRKRLEGRLAKLVQALSDLRKSCPHIAMRETIEINGIITSTMKICDECGMKKNVTADYSTYGIATSNPNYFSSLGGQVQISGGLTNSKWEIVSNKI